VGVFGVWYEMNMYFMCEMMLFDFEDFELFFGDVFVECNKGIGLVIGGFYDSVEFDLVLVFLVGVWFFGLV